MSDIEERIYACIQCLLHATCRRPVAGDGNFSAKILFIGEAPGAQEDVQGVPFVGRSGKFLTETLESIGLLRNRDYYITNIVKCRPPDNRDPTPDEIATCAPYLVEQINTMQPDVIVTLGRFSFSFLVPERTISQARGTVFRIHSLVGQPLVCSPLVLASYHPAVALYNPNHRETIRADLAKLPAILDMVARERAAKNSLSDTSS